MIIEETEAHKKNCHRVVGYDASPCSGAHCMAWRWIAEPGSREVRPMYEMDEKPDGDEWVCDMPDKGREGIQTDPRKTERKRNSGLAGLAHNERRQSY